jgi:hypothetical protein
VRVFELMRDHTWRPTSAVVNTDAGDVGDTLHDGDTVHVLTRRSDGSLYYVRLSFDAAARDYRVDPPQLVTSRGSLTPATIAKDTTGRLWVAYATSTNVVVTASDDGGLSWGRMNLVARTGTGVAPEIAALVAYDNRVGVMWSDQRAGTFEFSSHLDGAAPEVWFGEHALVGPAPVDSRVSLVRVPGEPSDTLVAAVKTARGDPGEPPDSPQIEVLIRAPGGLWSSAPVSTIADGLDDPVLQADETTRTLHLFASANGNIVEKRTSLDDIRFEPGLGDVFMVGAGGALINPAVTKGSVDSRSGLVVLASDTQNRQYRHAESPIVAPTPVIDPNDHTPPTQPDRLQGHTASPEMVVLSWAAATDGDRWSPAGDGVPARGYVVLRDGVEISTVTSTSIQDHPRAGAAGTSVHYQVVALDDAGNRSSPAEVVVALPAAAEARTAPVIGVGLLILAAFAGGAYALRRLRLTRTMGTTSWPDRERSEVDRSQTDDRLESFPR